MIDAIGGIGDDGGRRHAIVQRCGIDEGFEAGAGLALGLRCAVEAGLADIEAAHHGEDAAGVGLLHDEGAGDFRDLPERIVGAGDGGDGDDVTGAELLPRRDAAAGLRRVAIVQEAG